MPRMTPYALLAAVLVAFPAAVVAAQEAAADAAERPTFALRVEPRAQHAKPGDVVTFRVIVESRIEQRVHLAAEGGKLDAEDLHVSPHGKNGTTLTLRIGDDAPRRIEVHVKADSPSGETHADRAVVELAPPKPKDHGYRLMVEPAAQRGKVGEPLAFRVKLHSLTERNVTLAIASLPEGMRASVEPSTLTLGPGGEASAKLVVTGNGTPQKARFLLVATDGEARREAVLHAAFLPEDAKRPYPCADREACGKPVTPKPMDKPMPTQKARDEDVTRLYHQLLQRIARLEAALRAAGIHVEDDPARTP